MLRKKLDKLLTTNNFKTLTFLWLLAHHVTTIWHGQIFRQYFDDFNIHLRYSHHEYFFIPTKLVNSDIFETLSSSQAIYVFPLYIHQKTTWSRISSKAGTDRKRVGWPHLWRFAIIFVPFRKDWESCKLYLTNNLHQIMSVGVKSCWYCYNFRSKATLKEMTL